MSSVQNLNLYNLNYNFGKKWKSNKLKGVSWAKGIAFRAEIQRHLKATLESDKPPTLTGSN